MKTVSYFGRDPQFYEDLTLLAGDIVRCQTFQLDPDKSDFLSSTLELRPHILFIDCQGHAMISEGLRRLKLLPDFKQMLVCLLCADQEELNEASYLFSLGVNLSFIKSCDTKLFIRDCFDIAFEGTVRKNLYARAQHLRQKITVDFPASLTAVTPTSMWIGTDLELEGEVSLHVPLVPSVGPQVCPIAQAFDAPIAYYFAKSYEVNFPFPGAWDEPADDSILPETVTEWLRENRASLNSRTSHVIVYTKNEDLRRKLLGIPTDSYWLTLCDDVEEKPILLQRRPDLIFFDLSEGSLTPERARLVAEALRGSELLVPMIFFNSMYPADELRSLCGHEHILSHPAPLDLEIFRCLLNILLDKIQHEQIERVYLGLHQKERCFRIQREIQIVSLSEHEVWFTSPDTLPFFTNIFVKDPVPFSMTIIPGEGPHKLREQKLYRALIHGVDEEGLAGLRIAVNQLIYKPELDLRTILRAPLVTAVVAKPSPAVKEETLRKTDAPPSEAQRFTLQNPPSQRSKL